MIIREKDKVRLVQIFSTVAIPIEVWAYGSRVNGDAHEGSDLDLVIRTEDLSRLSIQSISALREKISNSNIPILVEIRDWASLPLSFQKNIEEKYEVLFSNIGIGIPNIKWIKFDRP